MEVVESIGSLYIIFTFTFRGLWSLQDVNILALG